MNSYGTKFKVTLYGESHQQAIGVVVDGVPPGIKINDQLINDDLAKRRPGQIGTTARIEQDQYQITSGVFNDYSTGSPIHVMIENKDVRSKDYTHLKNQPRPGHADFVANIKYKGFQDYRGGGRFSGRLTAALVCAGSLAKMIIPFKIEHELIQVGTLKDMSKIDQYLEEIAKEGDSVGGIIEIRVNQMPVGLGEPFFGKLDAEIAKMLFSIPAIRAVEFGLGFKGVELKGSEFNDLIMDQTGQTKTNNSGGVTGGISNGNPLVVRAFVKPTSSISKEQNTYHFEKHEQTTLAIGGRHDVCIARRVGIVLENAVAIVLADQYLLNG
jgi:chorismate synthase